MSVSVPNPLLLDPENALPANAATEGTLSAISTAVASAAQSTLSPGQNTQELLLQVLTELRLINYYLQSGLNVKDEPDVLRADPHYSMTK